MRLTVSIIFLIVVMSDSELRELVKGVYCSRFFLPDVADVSRKGNWCKLKWMLLLKVVSHGFEEEGFLCYLF